MYLFTNFNQIYILMSYTFLNRFLLTALLILSVDFFLNAQSNIIQKYENSHVFAGIEVGSKGVKMSFIEIENRATEDATFRILRDTTINTDFISFTQPTYQATLVALNDLFEVAVKKNKIPAGNVFTAISSGVNIQAVKADKLVWIDQLINSFKTRNNEPERKVTVVDVKEEARLSHLGIVPESRRFNTFLIDIGSGNTKGGYFPYGNTRSFKLFELTWGTKSAANAAEKMMSDNNSLENFSSQIKRVLAGAEQDEIIYAVNASGAFPKSDNVAFSGGIAWAVATLIAPELNDNDVVAVTYDDVLAFSEKLFKTPGLYSDYYIVKSLPKNTPDLEKIEKEVMQVNKVFNQRSLLSGTGLLLKIMRQFDGVIERKKFYLVKNGTVGWISAFVTQNAGK